MLVTPLRDGMNLVAKEYAACRVDGDGVLILSEFAGAAEQMRSAIIVNPYDVDGVTDSMQQAASMSDREVKTRMRKLQRVVRESDVFEWAQRCLSTLETR